MKYFTKEAKKKDKGRASIIGRGVAGAAVGAAIEGSTAFKNPKRTLDIYRSVKGSPIAGLTRKRILNRAGAGAAVLAGVGVGSALLQNAIKKGQENKK